MSLTVFFYLFFSCGSALRDGHVKKKVFPAGYFAASGDFEEHTRQADQTDEEEEVSWYPLVSCAGVLGSWSPFVVVVFILRCGQKKQAEVAEARRSHEQKEREAAVAREAEAARQEEVKKEQRRKALERKELRSAS